MNFYEQLFCRGRTTGEGMTHFERLFAAKFGGSPPPQVREYTGAVPVTITADGTPLLDFLISGNTVQNGTPTPQNPIMPQGCGDLETVGAKAGQYKIPISSANTTTPVYLGEVETTRKIKKLVLTGEENFNTDTYLRFSIFIGDIKTSTSRTGHSYCSHYECLYHAEPYDNDWNNVYYQSGGTLYLHDRRFDTVTAFKSYLAQQYATGTPVTVWYVLAEPTTGIVNEPLMKIGNYADTLSKSQAGVSIPTNNGSTTVDVDTTVKPSEVYIKYMG